MVFVTRESVLQIFVLRDLLDCFAGHIKFEVGRGGIGVIEFDGDIHFRVGSQERSMLGKMTFIF